MRQLLLILAMTVGLLAGSSFVLECTSVQGFHTVEPSVSKQTLIGITSKVSIDNAGGALVIVGDIKVPMKYIHQWNYKTSDGALGATHVFEGPSNIKMYIDSAMRSMAFDMPLKDNGTLTITSICTNNLVR